MRRMRRLTQLEIPWVDCLVSDLCAENCIDPRDPEYRSAAWEAFEELHQSHRQPWNGALFWPRAVSRMNRAIQREKRVRSLYLYQMLSMDAPLGEQGATLRDFLPVQGISPTAPPFGISCFVCPGTSMTWPAACWTGTPWKRPAAAWDGARCGCAALWNGCGSTWRPMRKFDRSARPKCGGWDPGKERP